MATDTKNTKSLTGNRKVRYVLARSGGAYLVLGVTLLMTGLAWYWAYDNIRGHQSMHFEQASLKTRMAIQQRMHAYVDALYGIRALFYTSRAVTRGDFQDYVNTVGIEERYPGIQGIGFIRRLTDSNKAAFIAAVGEELRTNPCGYPEFNLFPKGTRTEYFVVDFIEPILQNQALFGRDVAVEPACRAAMERARDSGQATATERILLKQGEKSRPGFILLVPIYDSHRPITTVEQRREALTGFVFNQFLTAELFQGIFGDQALQTFDVEVFDGEDLVRAHLLYDDDAFLHAETIPGGSQFTSVTKLEVGGRTWSIYFRTLPDFEDTHYKSLPIIILVGGLLLSVLAFRITLVQAKYITERQSQAAALQYQATHDSLTGLSNREFLYTRLNEVLHGDRQSRRNSALLLIDLDGFKEINDTLGHHSGDVLLRQIGLRLQGLAQPNDVLARLGGDEFALLMTPIQDSQVAIAKATHVLKEIRKPYELIEELTVRIDASVGIALYPEHGLDTNIIIRHADVAMYIAKKKNSGYALYDPGLDQYSPRRLALMSELAQAIKQNQLALYYQPKIAIEDGRVIGLEALIRWKHPTEGLLLPAMFIPQIEMGTMIRPLTLWVVEEAITQYLKWRDMGLMTKIAVNISARNLLDDDLPDEVLRLIEKHDAAPDCLEMEITESAIIADPDRAFDILTRLHNRGIRLCIDDFGTGYSSLAYLKKLPISSLKIDLSFIRDIPDDDNDAVIVHSTINLAHNLGLTVIAEGIGSKDVLDILAVLGCDQGQGSYICGALPAAEITQWLLRQKMAFVSAASNNR